MNLRPSILLALAALLSSCASRHGSVGQVGISCSDTAAATDVAGRAVLRATFRVPAGVPGRRARLLIVPQLWVADTLAAEYEPLLVERSIYARKQRRAAVLSGKAAPQRSARADTAVTLPFEASLQLPPDAPKASLRALLSADGCGECRGSATADIASVINWGALIPPVCATLTERPFVVRPKTVNGGGQARLQFVVDKWDILPSMGRNQAELDTMAARLRPVLTDTLATLNVLSIDGAASAEGPYRHNVVLAENRAASARSWIVETLGLPRRYLRAIRISAQPEGWEPVLEAMTAAGCADSVKVRDILRRYPGADDDLQERYIRRLDCWPLIRDNYLAKDRRVVYRYTYTLRNFRTDGELLRTYATRPDAFNEDELLRVAALQRDDKARARVYDYTLSRYPSSAVAVNNRAALLLDAGRPAEAAALIRHSRAALTDTLRTTLALACAAQADFASAEALIGQHPQTAALRHALGAVRAMQGRSEEAWTLLSDADNVVAAVVALNTGRTAEALRRLDACAADRRPVAEYARAMCAARLGRPAAEVQGHLEAARADASLARRIEQEKWPVAP